MEEAFWEEAPAPIVWGCFGLREGRWVEGLWAGEGGEVWVSGDREGGLSGVG